MGKTRAEGNVVYAAKNSNGLLYWQLVFNLINVFADVVWKKNCIENAPLIMNVVFSTNVYFSAEGVPQAQYCNPYRILFEFVKKIW
jgi:hypothetical protein